MSKKRKKRRKRWPSFHFLHFEIDNEHFHCKTITHITHMSCYTYNIILQESRVAARKPRDAASVLLGRSSPTTFLTSIRPAMLRKPRFTAPNMLAQNTI